MTFPMEQIQQKYLPYFSQIRSEVPGLPSELDRIIDGDIGTSSANNGKWLFTKRYSMGATPSTRQIVCDNPTADEFVGIQWR